MIFAAVNCLPILTSYPKLETTKGKQIAEYKSYQLTIMLPNHVFANVIPF